MNRVAGFMLKDAPSDKLANAIRNVAADQRAGIADAELAPPGDRHEELALRISLDQDVLNQRPQPYRARNAVVGLLVQHTSRNRRGLLHWSNSSI
ncbi:MULTISPECIES: hypothetical protein [unclassified Amycolatopsis]|uniref:hypothetical protein n=1 Tax=unclassified Amycolatopsis TaxID=2618356 RepID=UPI0028764E41|nr:MULTISPECIES: hypothetical protein [unclassified Amycolatopsis]MDS0137740.1 hypothetical protein [Amycolatopsis sp. 505]MDS0141934.1 hypothetical protein [Amycolatopsis sp. CM201R]